MFSREGNLDYINATQERLLENIERQVKELMRAEMPAAKTTMSLDRHVSAISKYNLPEHSRHEEFEGIMITFMNNQEKQIQHLETRMNSTRNAFMGFADEFISRIKEKIREKSTPRKIEKIFELPTPLVCDGEDDGKPSPIASPSITHHFYEHPQEEKNLQFHNIFVGSLQVTHPNLHKKHSFGFKPGVKRLHFKNTTASDTSMEQLLPVPTVYQYEYHNLSEILTSPVHSYTSIRDSNKMFDPGRLH